MFIGYNTGMSKSSVSFVEGIHISFGPDANKRGLEQWYLVGRVDGQPFYLHYLGMGATNWAAPEQLGTTLRRRILARFKQEVRGQTHPWMQEFSTKLFVPSNDPHQRVVASACIEFYRTAWRDRMLDDRDEDYVALQVPYADREKAQQQGAVWRADSRTWMIHQRLLASADVAAWLPTSETTGSGLPAN